MCYVLRDKAVLGGGVGREAEPLHLLALNCEGSPALQTLNYPMRLHATDLLCHHSCAGCSVGLFSATQLLGHSWKQRYQPV